MTTALICVHIPLKSQRVGSPNTATSQKPDISPCEASPKAPIPRKPKITYHTILNRLFREDFGDADWGPDVTIGPCEFSLKRDITICLCKTERLRFVIWLSTWEELLIVSFVGSGSFSCLISVGFHRVANSPASRSSEE